MSERIILEIDNEYCLSLKQLKGYFARDLKPDTRLYEELLTLQCDGMLQQWLEQGTTDDEQELARQLKDLSGKQTNSELMGELIRIFTGHCGKIDKPQPSTFLDLLAVECRVNGQAVSLVSSGKHQYDGEINLQNKKLFLKKAFLPEVQVSLSFKVKKKDNEQFSIKLMTQEGQMLKSDSLLLWTHQVGSTLNVDFVSFIFDRDEAAFKIVVDDEKWATLQLRVNYKSETFAIGDVELTMVKVKGGTFTMGAISEPGNYAFESERPVHQVTLSDYYIGEVPVTQALWKAVMGKNLSYFNGGEYGTDLRRPVERVSWYDCQDFIEKLNEKLDSQLNGRRFRLPTEAEWEFAARSGLKSEHHKYAGRDDIDAVAWYMRNSSGQTHPVGAKAANELDLFDMSGNVWEWCQDWYGSYSSSPQINPTGPSFAARRVCRGGSLSSEAAYCRVSYRNSDTPALVSNNHGFRLAL